MRIMCPELDMVQIRLVRKTLQIPYQTDLIFRSVLEAYFL
jgi:hypothetical protein